MNLEQLKPIIEAALLAAGEPLTIERLRDLFVENSESEKLPVATIKEALTALMADCETRGIELKELASGFCFQAKAEFSPWMKRLSQERAPRYSRALLETLAVIAYRQPVTRGEIEDIRGVAVSTNIVKTLFDREWVKVVGQREVPGRPSLYATTKQFLDHFNLKSLEELPVLMETQDLEQAAHQLEEQFEANQALTMVTTEGETAAQEVVMTEEISEISPTAEITEITEITEEATETIEFIATEVSEMAQEEVITEEELDVAVTA